MKEFYSVNDSFQLSNGVKIPCLGFGTWQTPDGQAARDSVRCALELGYRHIDTAAAYGNEKSVGEGIRLSGVKREDVFVTTKHWITMRGYQKTVEALETSLRDLGLDYLDLYLIHWPSVAYRDEQWQQTNADTWRAFEKMYQDGKVRAIGVSNFEEKHIEALRPFASVMPMVNQIEFHPATHRCRMWNIPVRRAWWWKRGARWAAGLCCAIPGLSRSQQNTAEAPRSFASASVCKAACSPCPNR